jgi:hypothetical protein
MSFGRSSKMVRNDRSESGRTDSRPLRQTRSISLKRGAFARTIGLHPIFIEMPAATKIVSIVSPINRICRSFLTAREGEPVARMKLLVSNVIGDRQPAPTIPEEQETGSKKTCVVSRFLVRE